MKKSFLFFFAFVTLLAGSLSAQDVVHRKNGDVVQARVLEIGTDEVKYQLYGQEEGPIYVVDKEVIRKIEFQDGRTETFISNFENSELYADQNKQALKAGFLSPLFGHTNFSYERSLRPGHSIEAKLGIIGLDFIEDNDVRGAFLSAGYRFYRSPDFYLKGMRYAHVLKGGYVKPEIIFGRYNQRLNETNSNGQQLERDINFGSVLLNLGKQWVFSDIFLIDFSVGLGYTFDNIDGDERFLDEVNSYHYAVNRFGNSNFSMSSTLSIGILF